MSENEKIDTGSKTHEEIAKEVVTLIVGKGVTMRSASFILRRVNDYLQTCKLQVPITDKSE